MLWDFRKYRRRAPATLRVGEAEAAPGGSGTNGERPARRGSARRTSARLIGRRRREVPNLGAQATELTPRPALHPGLARASPPGPEAPASPSGGQRLSGAPRRRPAALSPGPRAVLAGRQRPAALAGGQTWTLSARVRARARVRVLLRKTVTVGVSVPFVRCMRVCWWSVGRVREGQTLGVPEWNKVSVSTCVCPSAGTLCHLLCEAPRPPPPQGPVPLGPFCVLALLCHAPDIVG